MFVYSQSSAAFLNNYGNAARRERFNGRDYYVAPMVLISPGVLHGSLGPLLYPLEEIQKTAALWENAPITRDHPYLNGRPTSARTAGVLDRQGIGLVRNPSIFNGRLVAEGWFDVEDCRRLAPKVLKALERGDKIELSTGLFTQTVPATGVYAGREYSGVVQRPQPDHLAVFDGDQVGACSLRDGCGVFANSFGGTTMFVLNEDERREDLLDIPTLNFSPQPTPAHNCNCGCQPAHNQSGGVRYFNEDPDLLIAPEIVW